MKQRKLIATILTIILTAATVLTVFAAFRFEVQFPSKLNTFKYDGVTAGFTGTYTLDTDVTQLQQPGQGTSFAATVTGDATTPLTYAYTVTANSDADSTLLSSIFVYLNGEIQGTLQSLSEAGGLIGNGLYVLPEATENDTLRFELHLASDATPYTNASLSLTVTCVATNHNAQKVTFVKDTAELIQAISEVNRGAVGKTIVLYNNVSVANSYTDAADQTVSVSTEQLTVTNPCTFDVQSATFSTPITVNIDSEPDENGVPTDIVTVLSTKNKFTTAASGFTITKGAIDRKDSAILIDIDSVANATAASVQYIIDNQLDALLAHGISAGETIDLSTKGFSCYISEVTVNGSSYLQYDDENMTLSVVDNQDDPLLVSEVATATIKMATGSEHTHTVKVIGASDAVFANLFAAADATNNTPAGELYYLAALTESGVDVSYSVPLPTTIKSINATIEWHSSDPEKFSNQGVCSPSANGYVTLTAVIRINEQVFTKDLRIHIATLTNKDRLEAMIAAMGNITLSKLYPSEATDDDGNDLHVNGLIDGNYGDLPVAGTTTTGYEQYMQYAIQANTANNPTGATKTQISTFDISSLTYSIDTATYSYIDLVEFEDFAATDTTPAQTHQLVVLKQSTFNTLAEVQVTATFETGDSDQETSVIYVNIELGENKALGDQVLAYVRNKLSDVDVLQNMLDTRGALDEDGNPIGEKGDFELPAEYSGFDIVYQINSTADRNIVTTVDITQDSAGNDFNDDELLKKNANIVEDGQFIINAEGFKNVAHDVTITVSVLIKGDKTIGNNNVIASDDMTFTVPAAIHCDTTYGFSDSALFQSVRTQVVEQTTPAYSKNGDAFVDADKNYILVRDIENCKTLSIDGTDVTDVCLNGLAYFTNLTTFEARDFTGQTDKLSRAAATFKSLTSLTLSNVGLTDLTPVLELDLAYLDVSDNAGLKDISGVAKYDATKLEYLNVSGTAVDMERTRSLLTAMYYKYEGKNGEAPEYYYTHEYTPIADGALLLEPDAISVTTDPDSNVTTATIGGAELLINGATYDTTTKIITVGSSDTAISIDGKKSISVKAGTEITVLTGENHSSGDSVMLNDAIISFTLTSGMKSESFQIADLWLSGTVTISNATVSGNIITVGAGGGQLDSTIDDEDMTLTQGTIPVLSGIITTGTVNNQSAVIITPLKYTADNNDGNVNNVGNYRNEGLTDDGTNTVIGHENMTEIVISGATVNGTNIIVGANGGTITVKVTDQNAFAFAVRSNTTIQADTAGNMIYVNDDGTISILPIDNEDPALPTTASKVTFSDAEIYNKPSTIDITDENGTVITEPISIPTIQINAGCVMTIDDTLSVLISTATEIPLPSYAIGFNANGTVTVESYDSSIYKSYSNGNNPQPNATFSAKKFQLINFETTQIAGREYGSDFSWDTAYDFRGWYMRGTRIEILGAVLYEEWSATQTASVISGANSYLCIDETTWIPISTQSVSLTGTTVRSESNIETWGQILHDTNTNIVAFDLGIAGSYSGTINIGGAFSGNTTNFTIGITQENVVSAQPRISLPTESINPIYSGIRTTLPNATQSIAPNVVDYFGEKLTFFGCTLNGTTVTPNTGYKWYAILIDGEYITISDDASVTVTGSEGNYQVTVTNGTSTIGKGALVTKSDVNVTHSIGSSKDPSEIYAISGGEESLVQVTYQNIGADDGLVLAIIDDIRFEPIVANDEEKAGTNILFLLSEVPGVSHYDYNKGENNEHGTYIQLTPTVHYGNGGYYVSVTWSVDAGSMAYVEYADYYGSPRLETVRPNGLTYVNGEATVDVTVIAQVNVQGVVSTRYFTFTVTYYPEVTE